MPSSASDIQQIAADFIAHKVSPAYFARHIGEVLHDLAAQADVSRKPNTAMIRIAQALFFMASGD